MILFDFCLRIRNGQLYACENTVLPPFFIIESQQIFYTGEPYCIQKNIRVPITEEMFRELYCRHGVLIGKYIYGLYSIVIFDPHRQTITIIRSPLGDFKEIYYSFDQNGVVISSSLAKHLGQRKHVSVMTDKPLLNRFLRFGFLSGEHTLVKGVWKEAPGTNTKINLGSMTVETSHVEWCYPVVYDTEQAVAHYTELLREALDYEIRGMQTLSITLSSGYDSNFLLHLLRKHDSRKIDAYCIGGRTGRNETHQAEKIVRTYNNVQLKTGIVNSGTLMHLPDIVWRLEGTVYERGIFLQYELAKLLGANNVKQIIEGDGADQVMRDNYKSVHDVDFSQIGHLWHQVPDYALKYIVLKKNTKLLVSEGVTPHFPYLDIRLISCFRSLQKENGSRKALHIKVVETAVGNIVKNLLADLGGSTQICCLSEQPSKDEEQLDIEIRRQYLDVFEHLFLGNFRAQYQEHTFCDLTLEECLREGKNHETNKTALF